MCSGQMVSESFEMVFSTGKPLLLLLVVLLMGATVTCASVAPRATGHVTSVNGTAHFNGLIAHEALTLIKFFHPRCPNCIALAPHFAELAALIDKHNNELSNTAADRVLVAEVDASKSQNTELVSTHADTVPTIKLYSGGRLLSEYTGVRRADPMWEYVHSTLRFRASGIIEDVRTREDLTAFLNKNADRPVVVSVFHPTYNPDTIYPSHVRPSSERWHETARHMRSGSAPSVAFAAVADPDLLLPSHPQTLARFHRVARVPFVPALVAAPRGVVFWECAEWWFPALRESDSMETFMHVSVLPSDDYVAVDSLNARYILASKRPLAIVFGKHAPSWQDRQFLRNAARQKMNPRFVALYVNASEEVGFAEHVGVVEEDGGNATGEEMVYVVYRAGNSLPHVARYARRTESALGEWLREQAKSINRSNVVTVPGKVLELDLDSWGHVFEYDGRGVLLELYRSDCGACKRFAETYDKAARMLTLHTGAIVVARFDLKHYSLPVSPKLPSYGYVPTVMYVPPGGEAVTFTGSRAPRAIAKFARFQANTEDVPLNRLGLLEIAGGVLFQAGLVLTLSGIAILRRSQKKREHVT